MTSVSEVLSDPPEVSRKPSEQEVAAAAAASGQEPPAAAEPGKPKGKPKAKRKRRKGPSRSSSARAAAEAVGQAKAEEPEPEPELEAGPDAPPPVDPIEQAKGALKVTATVVGRMVAGFRGDHWQFAAEETELLAEAWAPVLAPYLEASGPFLLWANAIGVTYAIAGPRLALDRRLRVEQIDPANPSEEGRNASDDGGSPTDG